MIEPMKYGDKLQTCPYLILNLDIVLISADFGEDRIMKGQSCLLQQLEGDTGK